MPGKNAYAAVKGFIEPLRSAAACITHARLMPDRQHYELGDDGAVRFEGPTVALNRPGDQSTLSLEATIAFRIVRNEASRSNRDAFRVSTTTYFYVIESPMGEVLSFHWHPDGPSPVVVPHVHVGTSQLLGGAEISRRSHLASGRVAFEEVVNFLITEMGVTPIRKDYERVLSDSLSTFKSHRRWA